MRKGVTRRKAIRWGRMAAEVPDGQGHGCEGLKVGKSLPLEEVKQVPVSTKDS